MTHEDYERAANHWKIKDASDEKMDRDTLLKEIEQYIKSNNTCALATGSGEFVRVTPIEYTYHDGAFWMFSEGGEKFKALEKNKNVCLAIYDKYEGFGKLKGMQVTGTAEVVDYFSEEYIAAVLHKLPFFGRRQKLVFEETFHHHLTDIHKYPSSLLHLYLQSAFLLQMQILRGRKYYCDIYCTIFPNQDLS